MTPLKITVTALALVVAVPLARPADEPPKREARTLGGHTGTVRVLYAPDGTLATFSDDRTIQLRDGQGRSRPSSGRPRGLVITASFSPDSKTLATADGKAVRLWDVAKGEARTADGLPAGVERLDVLARRQDAGLCRRPRRDPAVGCRGREGHALLLGRPPEGRAGHHLLVAYAPDGKTLAVAYTDGHPGPSYLQLWDPDTGKHRTTLIEG